MSCVLARNEGLELTCQACRAVERRFETGKAGTHATAAFSAVYAIAVGYTRSVDN